MMPTHILVATLCVSLLAIYISFYVGLNTRMDRYIRCFLGYLSVDATHSLLVRSYLGGHMDLDYYAPYGLLYGPFLYFAYQIAEDKPLNKRAVFLHAFPFLFFSACYFLWIGFPVCFEGQLKHLGLGLYGGLSLSMFSYAVWALFFKSVDVGTNHKEEIRMISVMAIILVFVAVTFTVFTYSGLLTGIIRSQFKGSVVFLAMLGAAVVLFSYTIKRIVAKPDSLNRTVVDEEPLAQQFTAEDTENTTANIQYQKSAIPRDVLVTCEKALRQLVEDNKIYLDEDLSLALLAQQLKTPKHHLSQVFSQCINQNFNAYINQHRIHHAIELMHNHSEMSITAIYLNSGFKAKASFNRYFKQFQGCTPSEYRNRIN